MTEYPGDFTAPLMKVSNKERYSVLDRSVKIRGNTVVRVAMLLEPTLEDVHV